MSYWVRAYDIVQDKMPKWVVVKSYFAFVLAVLCFFVVVLFLPFQDKVSGKVSVLSSGKPIPLHAPQKGRLQLFVPTGTSVLKGEIIGAIQLNTSPEQIKEIQSFIFDELIAPNPQKVVDIKSKLKPLLTHDTHELNSSLIALYDALEQYSRSVKLHAPEREITATKALQETYASRLPELERTSKLYNESIQLLKDQLEQDSLLLVQGGISAREYEVRKMQLLEDLRRQLEVVTEQKKIKALIADQDASVAALQDQYSKNTDQLFLIVLTRINEVREVFNDIMKNNIILAPSSGRLTLSPQTVQFSDVAQGYRIGSMTSELQAEPLAIARLTRKNKGKVKEDMSVNLYLDDFPAKEYGIVKGKVTEIREIPGQEESELYIHVDMPITTSYDIQLPSQLMYSGRAEVVIDRLNLLQILTRDLRFSREKMIMPK